MARPPAASAPVSVAPSAQMREESSPPPGAAPGTSQGAVQSQLSPPVEQPLGGASVSPATATAPPLEPRPAPPAPPRPSRGAGPQDGLSPEAERPEAALARYESQLRAAVARISADAATCRDVCGASATICRAAGEICRLTQDADRTPPRDPRCRSARVACEDAGRRRDGACPTCPDAR